MKNNKSETSGNHLKVEKINAECMRKKRCLPFFSFN